MVQQDIHYCFTLSDEQVKFLRSKKYKIDRMDCFMSLVTLAAREKKILPLSKTQQVEILPGQVMVDYTQLAKLWDKDRKTVSKLMGTMEALGISSSQKIGENRIHTLHSLSGWYVDGKFRGNYFSLKPNADKTAIVHAEVPTAQVITVELPDEQSKPKESSGADSEKSTLASKGENPSADGSMSHLSPQSNDSGNVGKSGTDDKSSDVHTNGISHLADSVPSSHPEAEGNLNGGKGNDEPSAPQGGLSPQPDGNQFKGNGGYGQKPNGYNNPNGFNSGK